MKQTITHREARAWAEQLRRELLRQKRSVGDPRAPMRAQPGKEDAFAKVEADIATADFILKLIDRETRNERVRGLGLMAFDFFTALGLLSLVMLGVFAIAAYLYGRGLAVPALAIIGLAAVLAWRAVRNMRK